MITKDSFVFRLPIAETPQPMGDTFHLPMSVFRDNVQVLIESLASDPAVDSKVDLQYTLDGGSTWASYRTPTSPPTPAGYVTVVPNGFTAIECGTPFLDANPPVLPYDLSLVQFRWVGSSLAYSVVRVELAIERQSMSQPVDRLEPAYGKSFPVFVP